MCWVCMLHVLHAVQCMYIHTPYAAMAVEYVTRTQTPHHVIFNSVWYAASYRRRDYCIYIFCVVHFYCASMFVQNGNDISQGRIVYVVVWIESLVCVVRQKAHTHHAHPKNTDIKKYLPPRRRVEHTSRPVQLAYCIIAIHHIYGKRWF